MEDHRIWATFLSEDGKPSKNASLIVQELLVYVWDRIRYRVWVVIDKNDMSVAYQGKWKDCDVFIRESSGAFLLVPKLFDNDHG